MKNKILVGLTALAIAVALLSMSAVDLDCRSYALWALVGSGLWLVPFCYVNRDKLGGRYNEAGMALVR